MLNMTPFMLWATAAYFLLVAGLCLRKNRKVHAIAMGSAILMDLGLVLTLELQRDVIKSALTDPLSLIQRTHIVMSTIAVLLYFPVMTLGIRQLLFGTTPKIRFYHIRLGILAFVFRTLGWVFMFGFFI